MTRPNKGTDCSIQWAAHGGARSKGPEPWTAATDALAKFERRTRSEKLKARAWRQIQREARSGVSTGSSREVF